MKKSTLLQVAMLVAAVALLICSGVGCSRPKYNTIVRIHFAGGNNISRDANSSAFTNEFCSAEARALESQTLDKLSHAPGVWFKDKLPDGIEDGSAQLRPLLDDFLKSEWAFEMRDVPASPEYALAIRLDDTRAQLWQTNLRSLLESWTKITARNITGGWELKKDMPPNLFRVVRTGDWLIIGCGQDELPLSDAWSQGGPSSENETNETGWLTANVDWPRLAQIFPVFGKFDLPATQMQVLGKDGNLLLTGNLELSQPLLSLEPWQIPTNRIGQPLTSFTAVRGFASWFTNQSWATPLELSPQPDQAFVWSLGQMPLQTYLAVPVANSTNALAQLGQNLAADTNLQNQFMMPFTMNQTPQVITWPDVPFVHPEVEAVSGPSGDFLVADVIPTMAGSGLPPKLFDALNHDDLVFYHWEITSERLKALPQMTQLALLLTKHRQLDTNSIAGEWLGHIAPTLGDCVTEVSQTGPLELAFNRSAPAGLTAAELIALANWLEAPNFPGCDLSQSFPLPRHHHPTKKLPAPAVPAPIPAPH